MNYRSLLSFVFFLTLHSSSILGSDLPFSLRGELISASAIPRLPSVEPLQAIVKNGPPTERLRNLPKHDDSSSCAVLLSGEAASLDFFQITLAFAKAGVTSENLSATEREFLLAATSLHIAEKLKHGGFERLKGVSAMLDFLGVTSFRFSDEFLAVIDFWLSQVPTSRFFINNNIHFGPEIHYFGPHVKRTFREPDLKKRAQIVHELERSDYQAHLEGSAINRLELTPDIMEDFLVVREVLYRLRRRQQISAEVPKNLSELLLRLTAEN